MNFERLTLTNFQSYDELEIEFGEGLTLIYGPNGAGKSTIARALYTTLYPYRGRNKIGAQDLVDLIQDGEDTATSELVFSVGDTRYQISVEINRRSDGGARSKAEMVNLETDEPYSERSTDIEEKVTQLLGMNYEAFSNSTYAQQTELNRLIEASPGEREEILDNLLGLTAPDDHEDDINEVSKPVESWLDDKRSRLSNVREDIKELEADDPRATLQTKANEIEELDDKIEKLEIGVEEARERLQNTDDEIEDLRERQSELNELTGDRDEVEQTIDGIESEIEQLDDNIQQCDDDIEEYRGRISDLDEENDDFDLTDKEEATEAVERYENKYDTVNSTVEQARATLKGAKEDVDRLEGDLDDLQADRNDAESLRDARESDVEKAEQALEDAKKTLEERRNERDEVLRDYLGTDIDEVEDHEKAVRDRIDDLRGERSDLQADRESNRARRSRLADEISGTEAELEETRERREDIRQSLEADVEDAEAAFESAVDRADDKASQLGFSVTAADIDTVFTGSLPEELETALDEHRGAAEALADACETVGQKTTRIEDLRSLADGEWPLDGGDIGATHDYSDHIDRLEIEQNDAQATAEGAREDLSSSEERLTQVQDVAEALFEAASFRALSDVAAEIEELATTVDAAREERADLKQKIESLTEAIDDLDDKIGAGESALEAIKEFEDADETVDDAEREFDSAREDLDAIEDEIEELDGDIEDTRADLKEAREAVEEAEVALTDAENELTAVEASRDAAREARDAHNDIETLQSDRDGYRSRRDDKEEQLESKREELEEINSDIKSLESEFGDTTEEELQEQKQEIEKLIGDLETQLDSAHKKRDDARDAKSIAEDRLERLRNKRDQKADLEEKIGWANSLLGDFDSITETYDEVQTQMRKRVLDRLKHHTNKVFRDLYQNSTYEAVDIDEDYDLRLVSGSDTERDPHKASGGEGVLVTIALRAGVYRVLADQAEGRDDRLPPFLLDEPTNHLDESHIGQLEEAVDSIRDWNVPQVFVVDRYEGLIQDADYRVQVEMDDSDGASKVKIDPKKDEDADSAEAGGD
jgi:DNA repair exonuclease SbcCD ATPase subunit